MNNNKIILDNLKNSYDSLEKALKHLDTEEEIDNFTLHQYNYFLDNIHLKMEDVDRKLKGIRINDSKSTF